MSDDSDDEIPDLIEASDVIEDNQDVMEVQKKIPVTIITGMYFKSSPTTTISSPPQSRGHISRA